MPRKLANVSALQGLHPAVSTTKVDAVQFTDDSRKPLETVDFNGICIRRYAGNKLYFGVPGTPVTSLTSFGAIRGWINAILDEQKYIVLLHGLHLHKNPADFADLYKLDDIGHVNFTTMINCNTDLPRWLPDAPEDIEHWYVLNLRGGRCVLGKKVDAKLSETFKNGRDSEDIKAYEKVANAEAWKRYFKHEALEHLIGVRKGVKQVGAKLVQKWTGEMTAIESKFAQLGKPAEEVVVERAQATANGRAQTANYLLADKIKRDESLNTEVTAKTAGNIMVLVDGSEQLVTAEQLVKAHVRICRGAWKGGIEFLTNLLSVKSALTRASNQAAVVEVLSFAQ